MRFWSPKGAECSDNVLATNRWRIVCVILLAAGYKFVDVPKKHRRGAELAFSTDPPSKSPLTVDRRCNRLNLWILMCRPLAISNSLLFIVRPRQIRTSYRILNFLASLPDSSKATPWDQPSDCNVNVSST